MFIPAKSDMSAKIEGIKHTIWALSVFLCLLFVTNLWLNIGLKSRDLANLFWGWEQRKNILRISDLQFSQGHAVKTKGCPDNWICKKQYESEFHQDQNSKLWLQKGYCAPSICKRHSDCLVGDFCNGGKIDKGVCRLDLDIGYLIAKFVN